MVFNQMFILTKEYVPDGSLALENGIASFVAD